MDAKKILFLLFASALLIGTACAADGLNDFKIDKSYENAYNGSYYSIYLNDNQDSGIAIFKNVDDDAYDNVEDNDTYDNLVNDDGREYLVDDEDIQVEKNSDNTANFTDVEDAEHGLVELVKNGDQKYIVVFFTKDDSGVKDSDLSSLLTEFNKDNNVVPIAF